jgi:hypothetical protein
MNLERLWTTWADTALKTDNTQPMPRELGKVFVMLCLAEKENPDFLPAEAAAMHIVRIVQTRLQSMGVDCTAQVKLLIAQLSEGNPGNAVMYCHMVCRLQQLCGRRVDLERISYAFPLGFHTCNQLQYLWDCQKVNGMNLLDAVSKETFA